MKDPDLGLSGTQIITINCTYLEDITEENVKVCRQVLHIHAESSKTGGRLKENRTNQRRKIAQLLPRLGYHN
jgi:hypothetical protein